MTYDDIQTFSITFKSTNEAYKYITDFMKAYPNDIEIISDVILKDTTKMYKEDNTFKKLVKSVKDAQRIRDEYAINNNHKYNTNE